MRKNDFKTRALAVALTAAVALSSTACGSKSTADASSAATSQSESTDSSSSESTAATPAPTATPVPTATPAPAESTAETDDKSAQASQNGQNTNSGSTNSSDKQNNATSGSKGNTTSSGKTTVKAPAQAAAPAPTATPKPITYTYVVRKHPASCTTAGYDEHICQEWGGMNYNDNYVAPTGHDWGAGVVTKQATYFEKGSITYTCKTCGETKVEETPELDKTYHIKEVIAPTCTSEGYTIYECNEVPGLTYKGEYTAKLPHSWDDGVVTKAATCTEAGEKLYTCTVCDKTKTETIAAIGHDWEEKTTPATCKDTGSVDRTCKTCGVTEHVKDLPVTNEHIWDAGTVTKEANCTDKGETTYSCTVCGATKVEEDIAALGHDFHGGNCNRCGVSEDYDPEHFRQTIFTQTNEFRAENNRAPLTYLSQYQTVADLRAKEQATSYGHTRPNGEPYYTAFEELGFGDRLAAGLNGENAGRMRGTWFFEDWAVNGWSVSPGHRQAMLADAADGIVVGCYYDPVTQYYYAIQMFFSSELANQYKNSLASQSADPADAVAVQTVEPVTEQPVVTAAPAETSEQPTDKTEDEPSTVSTDEKPATSETAETEKESE